jgi:hypothetical protein
LSREILSIVIPPVKNLTGLKVLGGIVNKGCARAYLCACLVFTVKLVYILNELTVKKVERNVLGTNSGALSTVCASACNVEGPDNVEHFFLKAICRRLVLYTRSRVIKYALLAGASRTNVTASITAYAL